MTQWGVQIKNCVLRTLVLVARVPVEEPICQIDWALLGVPKNAIIASCWGGTCGPQKEPALQISQGLYKRQKLLINILLQALVFKIKSSRGAWIFHTERLILIWELIDGPEIVSWNLLIWEYPLKNVFLIFSGDHTFKSITLYNRKAPIF